MAHEETVGFEAALGEIERILRALEDGTTTLESALSGYERGIGLLRQCYTQLRDAESRIEQLSKVSDTGTPLLKPFDHTSSVERNPQNPRRNGRNGNGELL